MTIAARAITRMIFTAWFLPACRLPQVANPVLRKTHSSRMVRKATILSENKTGYTAIGCGSYLMVDLARTPDPLVPPGGPGCHVENSHEVQNLCRRNQYSLPGTTSART